MHRQFVREMPVKVDRVKSWEWLSRNYGKHYTDKSRESPLCRMCVKRGERIPHIVSEREKLAQKECKRRHDNVAKKVH